MWRYFILYFWKPCLLRIVTVFHSYNELNSFCFPMYFVLCSLGVFLYVKKMKIKNRDWMFDYQSPRVKIDLRFNSYLGRRYASSTSDRQTTCGLDQTMSDRLQLVKSELFSFKIYYSHLKLMFLHQNIFQYFWFCLKTSLDLLCNTTFSKSWTRNKMFTAHIILGNNKE